MADASRMNSGFMAVTTANKAARKRAKSLQGSRRRPGDKCPAGSRHSSLARRPLPEPLRGKRAKKEPLRATRQL
jgi:hypothetical protein